MRVEIPSPIPIVEHWTVAYVEYSVKEFVPSSHITFNIAYLDPNCYYLSHRGLLFETTIDGVEYAQWGTQDGYILNILGTRVQAALLALSQ